MKLLLFFLTIFFTSSIQAQMETDSLLIVFNQQFIKNQNCCKLVSYNGIYTVPKAIEDSLYFKNFSFIQPVKQAYKDVLKITALNHELDTFPSFEYPCPYLVPITRERASQINNKNKRDDFPSKINVYTYKRELDSTSIEQKIDSVVRYLIQIQDSVTYFYQIVDGVFIPDEGTEYYIDTSYFDYYPGKIDSIEKIYSNYRTSIFQKKVSQLMRPFYFSDFEISNREYRQFITWVRDSIALHLIYDSIDNDNARFLLNLTKKQAKKLNPNEKAENLKKYGLNYEIENYLQNPLYFPYTKPLYYPQPERYFRRREIDVRNLNYKNQKGDTLNVYPDTTATKMVEYMHTYYWHPSYDHFPIHSISYDQALAYCEWLQRQLNQRFIKDGFQVNVELPSLYHYEMGLKYNQPVYGNHIPENQKNNLYSTVLREEKDMVEYLIRNYQTYIKLSADEVRDCDEEFNMEFFIRYNNWYRANQSYPISHLNGNVSEYCSTPVTKDLIDFYQIDTASINPNIPLSEYRLVLGSNAKMDVIDLQGNQVNAIFYKQLVHKSDKKAFYGFRPVFYLYPVVKE